MAYTVKEVLKILANEGLTKNIQIVRRWLHSGELKGTLPSRKQGWVIQEEDLQQFINTRKSINKITQKDLDDAYNKGYEKGHMDTVRRLLTQGFGQSVTIRKSVLRYYVERDIARKDVQKAVLDWIFEKRSSINIRVLDSYVRLHDTSELVKYADEDQIAGVIADMARKKVIAGEERKGPWIA